MKFKHVLKLLLSRIHIKIRSGPLKGKKWIVVSGYSFIRGDYEPYKTEAFLKNFSCGNILFDIGAHIGYYSSIAADINDRKGSVYAFEPRPMNIKFFRRHMKINNFQNVNLTEAAAGESDGYVQFDDNHGSATGFVSRDGNIRVRQISIDRMVKDGELPLPDFIKIDVEGGEIELLKGLEYVISSARPKILVATHFPECHKYAENFLNRHNYRFQVLNPDGVAGDTEIIAVPE
jgi:FkbM family methyltransferase